MNITLEIISAVLSAVGVAFYLKQPGQKFSDINIWQVIWLAIIYWACLGAAFYLVLEKIFL